MLKKCMAWVLAFGLLLQQAGFAQVAAQMDFSRFLANRPLSVEKFRPVHLRYFAYDPTQEAFQLFLDKGDSKNIAETAMQDESKTLFNYFLVGITLPNDAFWVNLRPDSEKDIIDNELARTDVGKVMLEADLQLKKDTARFTSPATPKGKEYWNKLYQKAQQLYGSENVEIPTLTRPWIVPGDVIVRYTDESAYIYKASLKVMLEQDYLKDSAVYNFKDARAKELNEYASQLVRETIIPDLTKEINTSKRYAALRQVFYSLVLAQCFKLKFNASDSAYAKRIDSRDLTGLTSIDSWSKSAYYQEYKQSFANGEYNIKEQSSGAFGQTIRSYFSGGINPVVQDTRTSFISTLGAWGGNFIRTLLGLNNNRYALMGVNRNGQFTTVPSGAEMRGSRGAGGESNEEFTPEIDEAFRPPKRYPYSAFSIPLINSEDPAEVAFVEKNFFLVQAGKDYLAGKALVGRAAALTNWMWTDLLRNQDVIGLPLHQEKLELTKRYVEAVRLGAQASKRGDEAEARRQMQIAREAVQRYVEIRDTIAKRWISLALDAKAGTGIDSMTQKMLPAYAEEYRQKMFEREGYELLRDMYYGNADTRQAALGEELRNYSLYSLDPIGALVIKGLEEDVALFPLGAGGPGTVLGALSERGGEHVKSFLEANGIFEFKSERQARAVIDGTKSQTKYWIYGQIKKALLKFGVSPESLTALDRTPDTLIGYLPFKLGKEPIQAFGFDQLSQLGVALPERPVKGVFNPKTGDARPWQEGDQNNPDLIAGLLAMPRVNFEQGKPLETELIKKIAQMGGRQQLRSKNEVLEILRWAKEKNLKLRIVSHLRGMDLCGSSLDLPEFQVKLTNEGELQLDMYPSTPTLASEFKVEMQFDLTDEKDFDKILYFAPDYGMKKPLAIKQKDLRFEAHPDPIRAAAGVKKLVGSPGEMAKKTPAFIFGLFGITGGVKITCTSMSPIGQAGGMESSNAFTVSLLAAASMLSGANLSYAEIFNLSVKLENDELNGLTGGQGHLSSILGGAYHNIWLSGIRDPNGKRQFNVYRMQKDDRVAQDNFDLRQRAYGKWAIPAATVTKEQQGFLFTNDEQKNLDDAGKVRVNDERRQRLNRVIRLLNLTDALRDISLIFLHFTDGKLAHYSPSMPQIYIDVSLLDEGNEVKLGQVLKHEVRERTDVRSALAQLGFLAQVEETAFNQDERKNIPVEISGYKGTLYGLIDELASISHTYLTDEVNNLPLDLVLKRWADAEKAGDLDFIVSNMIIYMGQGTRQNFYQKFNVTQTDLEKAAELIRAYRITREGGQVMGVPDLRSINESFFNLQNQIGEFLERSKSGMPGSLRWRSLTQTGDPKRSGRGRSFGRFPGDDTGVSGGPAATAGKPLGGIDFRYTGLMTQFQESTLKADFRLPDLTLLRQLDIETEKSALNNLMSAGILPASERLTDFVSACYLKYGAEDGSNDALICLTDFFRLEEESAVDTDPQLKSFLFFMESSDLAA